MRSDLAAVRGQNEKVAAAISEIKSASPQGVMTGESKTSTIDTSAIEERIAKIERATAALSATAAAPPPAPQPPAEDPKVRRLGALVNLDKAVSRGLPYATELAAVRSVAGDADVLRALDGFATAGLPTDDALSKELLALLPQLAPKPEAQPAPNGIVERLQQSFAKLVRIQRTDALASGPTAFSPVQRPPRSAMTRTRRSGNCYSCRHRIASWRGHGLRRSKAATRRGRQLSSLRWIH